MQESSLAEIESQMQTCPQEPKLKSCLKNSQNLHERSFQQLKKQRVISFDIDTTQRRNEVNESSVLTSPKNTKPA